MEAQELNLQNDIVDFAEKTLVETFLKIARVNIITGEYEFLKKDDSVYDEGYEDIPDIYSYIKKQVDDKIVLSEYAAYYLKFSDPKYVHGRVFSGEKRIVQSYKRKSKESEIWVTFSIIAPVNCSPENPWALFTWRYADPDTITMIDAIDTLSVMYCKILKINLTADTFKVIRMGDNETAPTDHDSIKRWWKEYAEAGNIYDKDLETYNQYTDIDYLKSYFKKHNNKISCRYRRKKGDSYKWVQMDITPSIEYSNDNQVLILYVQDFHEEYLREINNFRELENNYIRDALTMLFNRHKYQEDIEKLSGEEYELLTCLYIDANGLHEVNNLLGHKKGDDMLCFIAETLKEFFPDERVYRIGGDEFVMLSKNLAKTVVEERVDYVRKKITQSNYAISAGVAEGGHGVTVKEIIGQAELEMRNDKELYYKNKGDQRLRRSRNEELEHMLVEKQDAEYFLKAISKNYAGVYFVNLKYDTIRHIFIPDHFVQQLKESEFCYSAALKKYMYKHVNEEFYAEFQKLMDYEYLEAALEKQGAVLETYKRKDGSWIKLQVLKLDSDSDDNDETMWIFSVLNNGE